MNRRSLLTGLRVVAAAGLLVLAAWRVQWRDRVATCPDGTTAVEAGVASTLRGANGAAVGGGCACMLGAILLAGLRWRMLLRVQGIPLTRGEALRLALLGELGALVLPGAVGSDVVRIYGVARRTRAKAAVVASSVLDRLIGVSVMAGIAVAVLAAAGGPRIPGAAAIVWGVFALSAAAIVACRTRWLSWLERYGARGWLGRQAAEASGSLARYGEARGVLARALLMSVAIQIADIGGVALFGHALGLGLPWQSYGLYVPAVNVVTSVPLTPGSIGVMEQAYLVCFGPAAGASQALALALLVRAATIVRALPGSAMALWGAGLPGVGEDAA